MRVLIVLDERLHDDPEAVAEAVAGVVARASELGFHADLQRRRSWRSGVAAGELDDGASVEAIEAVPGVARVLPEGRPSIR